MVNAEGAVRGLFVSTHLDVETDVRTAQVAGHEVLKADLRTEEGIAAAMRFFARVPDLPAGVVPVLAREPGRRFTDVIIAGDGPMNWVSVVNTAIAGVLRAASSEIVVEPHDHSRKDPS